MQHGSQVLQQLLCLKEEKGQQGARLAILLSDLLTTLQKVKGQTRVIPIENWCVSTKSGVSSPQSEKGHS
jgi:hypothetical protein